MDNQSVCANCFSFCPIKAHRVNGVVVKIEGNPDDPLTQGRICARGLSGINILYDPNRLDYPVKRTNPGEGHRASIPSGSASRWDEALDTITEKLKKVREDDPRKFVASFGVNGGPQSYMLEAFAVAYGTPNLFVGGAGNHCASGKHFIGGLTHAAWVSQPDFNYCNYFLNFGVPVGTGAYYGVNTAVRKMAEARARGMKHVVIDPWKGMPAQSADEWVPIRPGHRRGRRPGHGQPAAERVRHLRPGVPRARDQRALPDQRRRPLSARRRRQAPDVGRDRGQAKPYDAKFGQIALEVDETVDGQRVRSAFIVIKEHVKKYTPEMAAEISDVPAETIRRLAREIGEAARIGDTIELERAHTSVPPGSTFLLQGCPGPQALGA